MNCWNTLLAGALVTLIGVVDVAAAPGPVVVELFTSQGCNSCPPADALLGELNRRPDILALALHVTYWNDLGWQDKFSQLRFDERQRRYAQQLSLASTYTPQMVVNGMQDVIGSQRKAVQQVLDNAARTTAIVLRKQDAGLAVSLPALERPCDCVLTLFGLQPRAKTTIGRGENSGRTLEEFQIVRAMQPLGQWRGDAREFYVQPANMAADVGTYAVLAQERNTGRVVAAGR
ncbi:MAG: DUF1223 domain-containing protein [Pseudomonadota bacterium]